MTQLGDPNSHFRWIISRSITDSHVVLNAASPDWQIPNSDSSLAFQLIAVLEPTALVVLLFPVGQLVVRRHRFEGRNYAAWTSPNDRWRHVHYVLRPSRPSLNYVNRKCRLVSDAPSHPVLNNNTNNQCKTKVNDHIAPKGPKNPRRISKVPNLNKASSDRT